MLYELTDEEIVTIGQYRWVKKHILKTLVWFIISISCLYAMTVVQTNELPFIVSVLFTIAAVSPMILGLTVLLIKMDKAGKSFIKEIKGAK